MQGYICRCFYEKNIYLKSVDLHVTYCGNEAEFKSSYGQVLNHIYSSLLFNYTHSRTDLYIVDTFIILYSERRACRLQCNRLPVFKLVHTRKNDTLTCANESDYFAANPNSKVFTPLKTLRTMQGCQLGVKSAKFLDFGFF